jgi:glycerol-3-phosphate cytidylyltransferase-like family protein
MKKEKIVVVAGEFDPLSVDDLRFLKKCKMYGNWLIVGIHSDSWMQLCRNGSFLSYSERHEIVDSLKCVDETFQFNDNDGSVCNLLKLVKLCYPTADITYISNQDMHDMPETKIRGIKFEVLK